MSSKPFIQQINYFSPTIPLAVRWIRGNMIKTHPLTYHNDYEIHFIKQGLGKYIIGKQSCHFKTGHLVIIKPNQVHSLIPEPGHRLEKASLIFQNGWQEAILKKIRFDRDLPNLIYLKESQALYIEMIINRIIEENTRREKGWEDMIVKLFHEFLIWVQRVKSQRVKPVKEKAIIVYLHKYIESHFTDPNCQVASIAKHLGYSLNYITALSKEMSGMALKRYLLQYRIIAARRLLESNSDMKVKAVAYEVGFNQYRNFTRAFQKQTGMTASIYREFYHPTVKNSLKLS